MALPEFPNSPTVNTVYTIGGRTWQWRADNRWHPLSFNGEAYFVTPEMFGAVGDGTADDTPALTSFFTATSKTKMMRPGATYRVTGRLNMVSQQNVRLWMNAARIFYDQADGMYPGQPNNPNTGYVNPGIDRHILVLKNCKDIHIDGLRIRGGYNPANPQIAGINTSYWSNSQTNGRGEDGHGISLSSCENIVIENCEIVNVWGDAVWLQSGGFLGDPSYVPNKNITIRDNDMRNPFRGAVSSVHHDGLIFEGNYVEKLTGYTTAVLLEPNNNVAQNCINTRVLNNTIQCGPSGVFAATSAGALLGGDFVRDIVISGNTVNGVAFVSLTSPNTSGVVIENNSFYNSGLVANNAQFGLFLDAYIARDVVIKNNKDYTGGTSDSYYRGCRMELCNNISFEDHKMRPLADKTNTEYFQVINTNYFRLRNSEINGRDTTDPNGTPIVAMYGSSSYCTVADNYFNGTGTSQGVVYLEQSTYTGIGNAVHDNVITTSSSFNAIVLKANYFGTAVGKNIYTSGRVANVSGGTPQCYQHPTTVLAAAVHSYGTAQPTTGTWAAGSRLYNMGTGPTDYWECTVSGTPGTWVARN